MGPLFARLTPWAADKALLGEPISTLVRDGLVVDDLGAPPIADVAGLRVAEATWLAAIQADAVCRGVRFVGEAPFMGPRVTLEPGSTVWGGCHLLGTTTVASGAVVHPGCHLKDTSVGPGAELKPYTVADHAEIGAGAVVGPFAHLRSGTKLGPDSKIGNFVETKNTVLGAGAKANHLTYLGDAEIGARSNIGAGTITCNYDGARKHRTTIGEDVFVGTNSSLVAPVVIGDGALVAAGSVVATDVEPGALAITRAQERHLDGVGAKILARNKAASRASKKSG